MPTTQDIVQKLWSLCHVLRDDGITYHEYVTELTFLLFLKMAKETGTEEQIPKGYRWDDLTKKDGVELLAFYKKLLIDLGGKGSERVQAIFANASTSFRQPRHLKQVVTDIDALDWYSAKHEGLGDLYEGLLEKNAEETKGRVDLELKDLAATLKNIEEARPFEDLTVVCITALMGWISWDGTDSLCAFRTKLLLPAQISMRRPPNSFPRDAGLYQATRYV